MITAKRIQELASYDSDTGMITWRVSRGRLCKAGQRMGCHNHDGYLRACVDGSHHMVHRLVWLYVNGSMPDGEIDHVDGVRDNNRIANLRESDRTRNMQNIRSAKVNNKTGLLGVTQRESKKFAASINVHGKKIYLGQFDDKHDAHKAYIEAKRKFHEGNTI